MASLPNHNKAAPYLLSLVKDSKIGNRILYESDFYMVYSTSKRGFAIALNEIRTMLGDQFDKIINKNDFFIILAILPSLPSLNSGNY